MKCCFKGYIMHSTLCLSVPASLFLNIVFLHSPSWVFVTTMHCWKTKRGKKYWADLKVRLHTFPYIIFFKLCSVKLWDSTELLLISYQCLTWFHLYKVPLSSNWASYEYYLRIHQAIDLNFTDCLFLKRINHRRNSFL